VSIDSETTIVEPITLGEANSHLKITADPADVTAHPTDADVTRLISTAREMAEQFCQRAFAVSTREARGRNFGVPLFPPVTSIVSVTYLDAAGARQTLADTVYELNGNLNEPKLRLKIGQTWPAVYHRLDHEMDMWPVGFGSNASSESENFRRSGYGLDDAVIVQFVAGMAPAAVPFLVKAGMLLVIGSLFMNREEVSAAQTFSLPMRVHDLWWNYRTGLGV